jgi:hypothetical protein
MRRGQHLLIVLVSIACGVTALAQGPQVRPPGSGGGRGGPYPDNGPVRRIGESTYQIGQLRVDTAKRELTAPATVNDVTILEFVANTIDGQKAYESALTVDTDAVRFNTALLLLGVDPRRSRLPTRHFDPVPPAGDPLDIFVEWDAPTPRRVRVEELLFDNRTGRTLPAGPWVYTGSTFVGDPGRQGFLADLDGVLIGFVHSPAPVIENPRIGGTDGYGAVVFNKQLGLAPGAAVRLIVAAPLRKPGAK